MGPKKSVTSVNVSPPEATTTGTTRPWEDTDLSAEARYDSWKSVVKEHLQRVLEAGTRDGVSEEERANLAKDPENQKFLAELKQLQAETPEQFCFRIEGGVQRELLGKNFLGAKEWRAQGIEVGAQPPIPAWVTQELLESESPLHPGKKILETHALVLVPRTVNGEPYTALKLDELCAKKKGSGDKLIYDGSDWATAWKAQAWAKTPQFQSEWVLIPKSDPDRSQVASDKHFRSKNIAAQQKVHEDNYPQYREARALEVMTMALLYDLTHQERLLSNYYVRCEEPNASGGRVCVGVFFADGLCVYDGNDVGDFDHIGRALAWK